MCAEAGHGRNGGESQKTAGWPRVELKTTAPVVVVNAQSPSNVEVLEVEPFRANLLDEVHHDTRRIPEDIHLRDGGSEMRVHAHQLELWGRFYLVQEPLQTTSPRTCEPT
jgi:hypothetical protein